jgi:DNA polymerase-3 subunit alpha
VEIGLSGIALTDHECLSGAPQANFYAQEILKTHPDFKVAIGNEIYLTLGRYTGQKKYYHFILIAKNKTGFRALRELSSRAWMNSYWDRGLERVPTTYDDLEEIVNKYPNSLIATSACIGGELSSNVLELIKAEKLNDTYGIKETHDDIVRFVLWCKRLFGEDFYIECAPGRSNEQIAVNKRLKSVAAAFNCKMVLGSDAHYLKKEDRYVHKAYLNSKGGEREVDAFYEYAYLQDENDIKENISPSELDYDELANNSYEIYNKIENYSIAHKQTIPKVNVIDYPKANDDINYPVLNDMLHSDDKYERYWVNECLHELLKKDLYNDTYLSRLEEEADIKKTISEKLGTNMFSYPITLQHYVDLFWECGSTVGAGRGSSCSGLNHYLLGITQLDPIKWDLPFWRYLNKERVELGDIDIDLCPSKRPLILQKIKEERGANFSSEIDELSKRNLGCTLIATFGTEGTKSAVLTACRGYRGEGSGYTRVVTGGTLTPENEIGEVIHYDGIDVDTAQYLSSLIPSERGFLWPLKDVVYGNKDKNRKPITAFINEINKYPGLLDIAMAIEGIVNKRSSHASGVILFDEDPYEFGCFMKTPKGEIITQWDLHMCEACGMTKYDFLVTEVQDKIAETIRLLQKHNKIDSNLTLREVYDEYLHPEVLPLDNENIWRALQENNVLNIFQFDSDVGSQAAKKIKPTNIIEMSDANGLMRLMTAEKGAETPMEKYIRFKNNINLWYKEMDQAGLTKEEQTALEPYFKQSYGVPPSQEQLMRMLMDEHICGFSLKEANAARKIVGKKQMAKIPELHQKILDTAASSALGKYVWECGVGPQMGYSFSVIHALAYSFIGVQTIYLATNWNPIYWNTACLIVNSGSLEEQEITQIVSIYEKEDYEQYDYEDLPDRSGKKKIEKTTDYTKLANAIGDITSRGIKVSLIDINKSGFSFEPDETNNEILFGLKGVNKIGGPVIDQIISGRPYTGIVDFMNRCPLNKTQMVSLIKSGAFDKIDNKWASEICKENPRYAIMAYYISLVCDPKKRLTLQNFNGLLKSGLVPEELNKQKQVFVFNKFLKDNKKVGKYYVFDDGSLDFYTQYYDLNELDVINGMTCILQTKWDKIYKKEMDAARDWLKENQDEVLTQYNNLLFNEAWNKYATGNISAWEMESLCFYYHEHELANIDKYKYGIVNFSTLSYEPEVDYFFKRAGRDIPIFKLYKIAGTIISKDNTKASVVVLTTDGIVNVKFTKEYYAMYNRQISKIQPDGNKKVLEKGWFSRGTKIMVTGYRREDTFVAKTYKATPTHQLYRIVNINNKDLTLEHERISMEG